MFDFNSNLNPNLAKNEISYGKMLFQYQDITRKIKSP